MIKVISSVELYHWAGERPILVLFRCFIPTHMNVIILLLVASISVAALFLAAFIWNIKTGQYKDEISPPSRILFDDMPGEKNHTH